MKRKKLITRISRDIASPEVLEAMDLHEAKGYQITNMKETLLNNVVAFDTLSNGSYNISAELEKKIPKRAVIFFDYAISTGNTCLVCSTYFRKRVADLGIKDFDNFEFTDEEKDLLEFAQAISDKPNHVPDAIYEKIQARYDEETLVLLVTSALFILANNYFNNIVGTELDEYLFPYHSDYANE